MQDGGDQEVEQQAALLLRDLAYNPDRLETWQQLAGLYQEAFRCAVLVSVLPLCFCSGQGLFGWLQQAGRGHVDPVAHAHLLRFNDVAPGCPA